MLIYKVQYAADDDDTYAHTAVTQQNFSLMEQTSKQNLFALNSLKTQNKILRSQV